MTFKVGDIVQFKSEEQYREWDQSDYPYDAKFTVTKVDKDGVYFEAEDGSEVYSWRTRLKIARDSLSNSVEL